MTEIPDLGMLFGRGGPQPQPSPEDIARAEAEHARQHREQEAMVTMMAHWAPLLCCCRAWPERGNTRPPQEDCPIHGHVMMNACTGLVYMPGQFPPKENGSEHQ